MSTSALTAQIENSIQSDPCAFNSDLWQFDEIFQIFAFIVIIYCFRSDEVLGFDKT